MRYQYKCENCNKEFELVISIKNSSRVLVVCPHCNSLEVIRKWNVPFIKFTGSGFYKTDNNMGEE